MRTASLALALAGIFNVAFANVVCNSNALHSKPRILSAVEKEGFAKTIADVCSATTDNEFTGRSGSTVFGISGAGLTLDSDVCEASFNAMVGKCVAGLNFGGGSLVVDRLTLEISTTSEDHSLQARGRTRTRPSRKKRPAKKRPTKKRPVKTPKKKPTKKPKKQPAKACAWKPAPKKGVRRFISSFLLPRAGSSSGSSSKDCNEVVEETLAFQSVAAKLPHAKNGE
ncbi:hypothetical protein BU23DRAFT_551847 [Bimuria novae-zelandiae CBS 107.79]|uniref:Ecp2 effector protein domain-containing protein n=1 Tax=Bimuria novae-zelandiae CBS 107.79 TaxID=1447943 RepID=A0A6A5VH66_9PLEO|nr:hypothetical protein BU23DRAFT_551847 [Bimuria novae-zelandiae CBS 107.79]